MNQLLCALTVGLLISIPMATSGQEEKKKTEQKRRLEALKKQAEEEKENRPDTIKFSKKKTSIDPSKVNDLTFDDIKFDMEKGGDFQRSMLTDRIVQLDGVNVRLRGYIRPSFRQKGLTKFVFVRDNKECCFGPGAAIFDCVLVELIKGTKTDYTVRPVTVEGQFYLKEFKGPDGKIWAVYRMKDGEVH